MFFSNPVKINLQLVHADQGAEKVFGCFVRQQATAESWWVGEHSHCTVHKNGQCITLLPIPLLSSPKRKKKIEEETFKKQISVNLVGGEEYPITSCRTVLTGTQHYGQNLAIAAHLVSGLILAAFMCSLLCGPAPRLGYCT